MAPRVNGQPTLAIRRLGHQVPAAQLVEVLNIVLPQRISGGGSTQFADDGHCVAGLGASAAHWFMAVQVAQHGHRDDPLRRAHQITADDPCAKHLRLVPHSVGQSQHLLRGSVTGRAECDDERGGPRTHRLDVGRVLRDRLAADVVRRGPIEAEMPALDEHVGGNHRLPAAYRHHRRIVARSQRDSLGLIAASHQSVDDAELAKPGQALGRVVGRHDTSFVA